MKDFILPLIALIGGVASLYIDSKDTKKRWIFLFGLIVTAVFTMAFNYQTTTTENEAKNNAVDKESKRADNLENHLRTLMSKIDLIPAKLVQELKEFGYSLDQAKAATLADVTASLQADEKYQSLVNEGTKYPGINVEYRPKGQDSATVKKAIETLGMKVRVLPEDLENNTPTNRMWVGQDVPDDAVRFVAITLLRAGADIGDIRRIKNPVGERTKMIQIGSQPNGIDRPRLRLSEIEKFSNARL